MSLFHPTRGGTRGGRDQFKWDDVKGSKDRELFLGHSLKAPVGRWQAGKDLQWYTKSGKEDSARRKTKEEVLAEARAEAAEFNRREERMRMEELGLAPRIDRRAQQREQLDTQDQAQLLRQINQQAAEERDAQKAAQSGLTQVGLISSLNPEPQPLTKAADPAQADRLQGLGGGRSNKHFGHELRSLEDRLLREQHEEDDRVLLEAGAPDINPRGPTATVSRRPLQPVEREQLLKELQELEVLEQSLMRQLSAVSESSRTKRRRDRPSKKHKSSRRSLSSDSRSRSRSPRRRR